MHIEGSINQQLEKISLNFLLNWAQSGQVSGDFSLEDMGKIRNFDPDVIKWLIENEYIVKTNRKICHYYNSGPKRKKSYSKQDIKRAEKALSCPEKLKPSTLRYYRSVLGVWSHGQKYSINPKGLSSLLENKFGLPDRINATEFALKVGLPTKVIKAWFRDLIESGKVKYLIVNGKRIVTVAI